VSSDEELEAIYLGQWSRVPAGKGFADPGRQIMHCTFGSVLTDAKLAPMLRQVLQSHRATYDEVLSYHFAKHLKALNAGM
jgi:hypothetical protein